MLISEAIAVYLEDGRIGLAAATVDVYTRNLERLGSALDGWDVPALEAITPAHMRRYFAELRTATGHKPQAAEGYSDSTLHQHFRTVRTWLNWCVRQGWRPDNPLRDVRPPPTPRPLARHLHRGDIDRLIIASRQSRNPERDHAIVILFLDTGIRRQELAALQLADVDLAGNRVSVQLGKMGRGRQVPLSRAGAVALAAWLQIRAPGLPSLFGLVGDNIYQMMRRLQARAGLPRVTPHALRHTFATYYDGDIYDLARILGHRDLTVTAQIYAHRELERLAAVHDERSPVSAAQRRRHKGATRDP